MSDNSNFRRPAGPKHDDPALPSCHFGHIHGLSKKGEDIGGRNQPKP
jgi:hypothetical protein